MNLKPDKICAYCYQQYSFHPKHIGYSIARWQASRFCSNKCSSRYYAEVKRKPIPTKNCASCGKLYKKLPKYSPAQWDVSKNCSPKCGAKSRTTKVDIVCPGCSKMFLIKKYRTIRSKVLYCTPKCRSVHAISPIHKRIRKSKEFAAWRKAVFERDDYTCQLCGERGGVLHPDHIKQFAYYPELRFDLDNGRTLCADCHRKTPTWGAHGRKFTA